MADRIGQQLGNYRLVRLLGTGGFAEVYLGKQVYLKSPAGIKVLHTYLAQEDIASFHVRGADACAVDPPAYCALAGLWRRGEYTVSGDGLRAQRDSALASPARGTAVTSHDCGLCEAGCRGVAVCPR